MAIIIIIVHGLYHNLHTITWATSVGVLPCHWRKHNYNILAEVWSDKHSIDSQVMKESYDIYHEWYAACNIML